MVFGLDYIDGQLSAQLSTVMEEEHHEHCSILDTVGETVQSESRDETGVEVRESLRLPARTRAATWGVRVVQVEVVKVVRCAGYI